MIKKLLAGLIVVALALCPAFLSTGWASAEEESKEQESTSETEDANATNISLTPVSKILQIASGSVYDNKFTINNDGARDLEVEVFAAPYSYIYSEENDSYQLGFNNQNNFTQLSRWVTFKGADGNYAKTINLTLAPKTSKDIEYRITTPDSIPAGGQYAVIFARTTNGVASANGIKTEASPGMVVYGRSTEGETITSAEISNLTIEQTIQDGDKVKNNINASAKVKNTGNVDFMANGKLVVDGVIGWGHYETETGGRIAVIPETELVVSDEWKETPGFGIFKVTWTVEAAGQTEVTEKIIVINVVPVAIIIIILLTIIIVWCIMRGRKRKERRSRLSV